MPSHASSQIPPKILIVMAVFRPDPEHLARQLASLKAQSHLNLRLIAVIADTVSGALVDRLGAETGLTDIMTISCDTELDSVRAFETGLWEADAIAQAASGTEPEPLIALCDQDDIWHADRLARGVAALAGSPAQMVHSDARLVEEDGTTLRRPSMFRFERRHKRPGLRGLLYRNNITGMTLLMRARVVRLALPFPPQAGVHFYHDLWLGLLAAGTGGVQLIDAPLVDYRQHGTNAIGAVDREVGWLRGSKGVGTGRRLPDAMWVRREAAAYALARYLAHSANTRLVDAVAEGRLPAHQARTRPLRPFMHRIRGWGGHLADCAKLALTGHLGLARIAFGFAVVSVGRNVWTLREAMGDGVNDAVEAFDTRLYSLSRCFATAAEEPDPQTGPTNGS